MPGKGHLRGSIEDTEPDGIRWIDGREYEGRLAQIELRGEQLHLLGAKAARIRKHRQWIAAELSVREDVDRLKLKIGHRVLRLAAVDTERRCHTIPLAGPTCESALWCIFSDI